MNPEALDILNKVKSGEITSEEAAQLLQQLDERQSAAAGLEATASAQPESASSLASAPLQSAGGFETPPEVDELPDLGWWKKAWLIPLGVGTVILVLAAIMMGWSYSAKNFFWFYCSWLPMVLGLLVLFLGWWSQQARWVHIRVKEAGDKRVTISVPLPFGLAGWLLRIFGRFIPSKMDPRVLENLPEMLDAIAKEKGPTTIEVDEKDGSRVRVYII